MFYENEVNLESQHPNLRTMWVLSGSRAGTHHDILFLFASPALLSGSIRGGRVADGPIKIQQRKTIVFARNAVLNGHGRWCGATS
ncbi:hypothetical protein M404DRAFT_687462 [Pisolithus tinctorius Marx 270]|uniref:Uncharacterized protein n=1 Tax=Pisolithus tinctorius Marx 270 TaxID=870435 RepID=A0A0C3PTT8_PISTI|nr:hypothetical protein M404DRAFT_687462 [Pisolithus tinctorius Marx 270]